MHVCLYNVVHTLQIHTHKHKHTHTHTYIQGSVQLRTYYTAVDTDSKAVKSAISAALKQLPKRDVHAILSEHTGENIVKRRDRDSLYDSDDIENRPAQVCVYVHVYVYIMYTCHTALQGPVQTYTCVGMYVYVQCMCMYVCIHIHTH